jgi:UDP-2,3-diacylglucosamine hydrolase
MKKTYFISDAHLGIESQQKEELKQRRLIQFFKAIEADADQLFIVGDLFDFWIDYRWVIPRGYLPILSALRELSEFGVKVSIIAGNHDFWLGNFFTQDMNIAIHNKPLDLTLHGKRFYIAHGDGLNRKDFGYRFLKLILRNPVTYTICRLLHPDVIFTLARWCSTLSRGQRPDFDIQEPYIEHARELFMKGYDYVIFAHTHNPIKLNENQHTYINIGEWINRCTYAVYNQGKLDLKIWKGPKPKGESV